MILYYQDKASRATKKQLHEMKTGQLLELQFSGPPSEKQRKFGQLRDELLRITESYPFPAPEPNNLDLQSIRQLRSHFASLVAAQNSTLGQRLRALHALCVLDRVIKDYDAFERRTVLYLQLLHDADLPAMYLVGGYNGYLHELIEAGQFEKAKKLLPQWLERSVTDNDADTVYRFCGSDTGGKEDPWIAVLLLDRVLTKRSLSPLERYEGLALRAIALDSIEKLLATPQDQLEKFGTMGEARWIQSVTTRATRATITRKADYAARKAASAWQSLGAAKNNEARPYSTFGMDHGIRERLGYQLDATRLQEISAHLNAIVQQRRSQHRTTPRSNGPAASAGQGPRRLR